MQILDQLCRMQLPNSVVILLELFILFQETTLLKTVMLPLVPTLKLIYKTGL